MSADTPSSPAEPETVVCIRRYDPVLRQTVFEPLPAPSSSGETPAQNDEPIRGHWFCDKCGFTESRISISVTTGEGRTVPIADDPRCPNDGEPLRSKTWREFAKEAMALPEQRDAEIARLRDMLEAVETEAEDARQALALVDQSECARLRAEVEQWQQTFATYSAHRGDCLMRVNFFAECSCEYSAMMRELDAAATPPAGDARGA